MGEEADFANQPSYLPSIHLFNIYHLRCCVCYEDTKTDETIPVLKDLIVTWVTEN